VKYLLFLCIVVGTSRAAFSQVVNPTIIYQDTDIALHNTDVYYRPFAPPDSTDTRMGLSCLGSMDSNGILHYYYPMTHGMKLSDWHPCYDSVAHKWDTIGNQVPWQRLFSANDKPNGAHSDLIAGGAPGDRVIISKNEDVDFRATGRIKLKSGFHAKPGCFFHAYTAPKFDTAVFTDDFDSNKLDRSKWYISNGAQGYNYPIGNECSVDSNISMDTDYQARDGHALDIVLREVPGNCNCEVKSFDFFDSIAPLPSGPPISDTFAFSTAIVHSYKFPFQLPWYPNFPYGRYEVRDKVPIVEHHLNNWGGGAASEWDLCEKVNGGLFEFYSGISHRFLYGPFKGKFAIETFTTPVGPKTDTTFRCKDAHWSLSNNPSLLVINGFSYEMGLNLHHDSGIYFVRDTFLTPSGLNSSYLGIPSSLKFSTDSLTFYYIRQPSWVPSISDSVPWHVKQDDSGRWRKFYAPYRYLNGDSLRFSKAYQPTSITLKGAGLDSSFHVIDRTYSCHWEYNLNHPIDSGIIYLDDTLLPTDLSNGDSEFYYTVDEGPDYPVPGIAFDTTKYQYHTFTMELLPHEMRILYDGNVRLRFPDRLIPPSYPQHDCITKLPRAPMDAYVGEFDIDGSYTDDPLGTHPGSITYQERKYFEWADTMLSHGCWDVQIPPVTGPSYHAAHHLIDYIDILDLPQGMKVPEYPH
jgi:hypothetical protein